MSALLRPSNPTLSVLRLDERDKKKDGKRKPSSTLGAEPRIPAAIMAEVEASMVALTGEANGKLAQAVKSLLVETEDGTVDPKAVREVLNRVRMMPSVVDAVAAKKASIQNLTKIERFNSRDIQRAIGIAVPEFSSPIGEKWRREHVALITSLGDAPKDRMVELLRETSRKQTRVEALQKRIEEEYGVNERRARLIARDQVLTLNSKLTEDRHKRAGITHYKWKCVGSPSGMNTRDWHWKLDGQIIAYDSPGPMGGGTGKNDRGHAGSGIGCRCQQIPVLNPKTEKDAPAERQPPRPLGKSQPIARRVNALGGVSGAQFLTQGVGTNVDRVSALAAAFSGANAKRATLIATGQMDVVASTKYAESVTSSKRLPPIELTITEYASGRQELKIADGRHRAAAAKKAGATDIRANVTYIRETRPGKFRQRVAKNQIVKL